MSPPRRTLRGAVIFGVVGLLGPLLSLLIRPASALESTWPALGGAVYRMVTLLWPAGLLALGTTAETEPSLGALVLTNVLGFALLGGVVGLATRTRKRAFLVGAAGSLVLVAISRFLVGPFNSVSTWAAVGPVAAILWGALLLCSPSNVKVPAT